MTYIVGNSPIFLQHFPYTFSKTTINKLFFNKANIDMSDGLWLCPNLPRTPHVPLSASRGAPILLAPLPWLKIKFNYFRVAEATSAEF
jgi:hypothetical protein